METGVRHGVVVCEAGMRYEGEVKNERQRLIVYEAGMK